MTERNNKLIDVTDTIIIKTNIETVFDYISDLRNDKHWRAEINNTSFSDGLPGLNSIVTEDSFLSKRVPNYVKQLKCVEYNKNNKVVYQTLPDNKYFLQSIRSLESLNSFETKVTYHLLYDKEVVKYGVGFSLPAFLINYVTRKDMKKYLVKLKSVLEKK